MTSFHTGRLCQYADCGAPLVPRLLPMPAVDPGTGEPLTLDPEIERSFRPESPSTFNQRNFCDSICRRRGRPLSAIEHGTAKGYQKCRRRSTKACDLCKKAWAAYTRGTAIKKRSQCKWCFQTIHLPDVTSYVTFNGDRECLGVGSWGWHDPAEKRTA